MSSAPQTSFVPDELLQYAADFKMFCEQLVSRGVELAIKLKDDALQSPLISRILAVAQETAVDASSRVWSWMQQTPGRQEADISKEDLLLPQAVVLPFGVPHVDEIADSLKTDLQLIHQAVIQQNEGHAELRRLLKKALRLPERSACCSVAVDAAPSTAGGSFSQQESQACRFREMQTTHMQRLELPVAIDMSVKKPPIMQYSADLLKAVLRDIDAAYP